MDAKQQRGTLRIAVWQANEKRCLYCEEPVAFRELEVDHLIPATTSANETSRLIEALGLPKSFELESTRNLVPSHGHCNSKKWRHQFSENNLRFFLEIWAKKQARIEKELKRLRREADTDALLSQVAAQVETGSLSVKELVAVVEGLVPKSPREVSEPLVVCFGTNLFEDRAQQLRGPSETDVEYNDRLESELLDALRKHFRRPITQTEPSARTGETVSLRVALWHADLDRIGEVQPEPWDLLEIVPYSEVYSEPSDNLFLKAVEETYSIYDAEERGCPKCGGEVRVSGTEDYAIGTCGSCGWEDYYP